MSHYDHRNNVSLFQSQFMQTQQDDRGYDHQRDDYNHQPLTKTFYKVASEEFEKKRKPERELLYKNLFSVVQDNGLEALRTETIPFVHISAAFEGNTKLGQTSWPVEISYVEFSIDRGVHAEETLAVKFLPFPLFGMRMQELEQQRHQVLDDIWMSAKETGINATAETTFHPQRVWERLAQIIGYPEAKWKIYVEATAWNATVGGIVSLAKIRHEDDEAIEKLKTRFRCLEDAAVAFLAVARNRDHFDPRLIVAYKGLAEYGMEVKSEKEFKEPQCMWHEEHFPRHRPNRVRCSLRRSHANISNFLRLADENALVGFHNKFGSCIDSNRATPPNRFEGASPFYGDSRQRQCEGDHSPPRRPPSPPRRQEMVERPRHYENRAVDMKKAEPIVSPVAPPPAREEPLIQEQHPRLKKEYLAPTVDLYDCTESEWDDDRTAVHMIKMGLREGKPCDPQHRPPGKVVLDEVLKVERTRNGKGRTTSTRSSALALAPAYARLKPGNVNNAINNLKNGYINGENKINSADRNVNSSVCLSSEGAPRGEEGRGSATSTTRTSTASSSSIGDVVPTLSAAPTFGNLLNVD